MAEAYFLSADDVKLVKELLAEKRSRRGNTEGRPGAQEVDHQEHQAPEVYVGKAKTTTGVPMRAGSAPGVGQVDVYQLSLSVDPPELEQTYLDVTAYNASGVNVLYDEWVVVHREKGGAWFVQPVPFDEPVVRVVGRVTGGGDYQNRYTVTEVLFNPDENTAGAVTVADGSRSWSNVYELNDIRVPASTGPDPNPTTGNGLFKLRRSPEGSYYFIAELIGFLAADVGTGTGSGSDVGTGTGSAVFQDPPSFIETDVNCIGGVLYRSRRVVSLVVTDGVPAFESGAEVREAIGCCDCPEGGPETGTGSPEPPGTGTAGSGSVVPDCSACPNGAPDDWTLKIGGLTDVWADLNGWWQLEHEGGCVWSSSSALAPRWYLTYNQISGQWTVTGEVQSGLTYLVTFLGKGFDCCASSVLYLESVVGPDWTGDQSITVDPRGDCVVTTPPEPPMGDCEYQYPARLYGTWDGFTGDCTQFVGSFALTWDGTAWVGTDPSSGATVTVTPVDFSGGTAAWTVDIAGGGCGFSYTTSDVTCGVLPTISSVTVTGCCTGVTQLTLSE